MYGRGYGQIYRQFRGATAAQGLGSTGGRYLESLLATGSSWRLGLLLARPARGGGLTGLPPCHQEVSEKTGSDGANR